MRFILPALALLLLSLIACTNGGWGSGAGDDDDSGGGPGGGDCASEDPSGHVNVDPECLSVQPYEEFDPDELIEWQWTGSEVDPEHVQVMMAPIVVNLTDDNSDQLVDESDTPDVLFSSYVGGAYTSDGRLRAISGQDGADLWTVSDPVYAAQPGAGLAAGDLDGDQLVEIVAITDDGEVMLVEHDGTVAWVTALGYAFGTGTHPAIADLMGDGDPEIIIGRVILSSVGTLVAEGEHGWGSAGWGPIAFAADVDHDQVQEVIVDNAVYEPDGTALWANGGPEGFPAVGDFDLDGDAELVVVAGGFVYLYDAATGATVWGPSAIVNEGRGGPPTVADYDGDGYPEIGVAGLGAYTVLDTDGSMMWWNPTEDDSSNMTGSAVFDFNGDGVAEVVYADEHNLYVYEGPTGTVLFTAESHASGTLWEYPVIVDIDHDFSAEIVLPSNDMWWEGWCGITVLGALEQSWYPARGIWNQHAYSITNIEDDGSVPTSPMPPWVEFNSFRRNTISDESVLHAPDVFVHEASFCTDLCPHELVLQVKVGNEGLSDLPPGVAVSVWHLPQGNVPDFAASEYLADDLLSGTYSEPLNITLDAGQFAGEEIRIAVDVLLNLPEGLYDECDEDDNVLEVLAPSC